VIPHLGREVRRQLRESGPTGLVALLLVAVATTWGGVLWEVRGWVTRELLDQDRPATVVATLRSPSDAGEFERALAAQPIRIVVTVTTPAETKSLLSSWFPELSAALLGLDDASFPTLLQIEVPAADAGAMAEWLRRRPEVTMVENSRDWQGRVERTLSGVMVAGFGLAAALLVGCGVVVLLVVRLLVLEHRDEIAIMRLIGAREVDIRLPYLACGSLLGLGGGALGVLILLGLGAALLPGPGWIGVWASVVIPLFGAAVGALGAGLGLASLPIEP
jgi:cell division protein FtsX